MSLHIYFLCEPNWLWTRLIADVHTDEKLSMTFGSCDLKEKKRRPNQCERDKKERKNMRTSGMLQVI